MKAKKSVLSNLFKKIMSGFKLLQMTVESPKILVMQSGVCMSTWNALEHYNKCIDNYAGR